MNTITKLVLAAAVLGVAGNSLAGEESRHVMAIEVAGDTAANGVSFRLDSDELGFDLDEMQMGETRSVVDESGRAIMITRSETGFSFNVDGETIELPHFADMDGEDLHWVGKGDDADVNVQVVRKHVNTTMSDTNATVIFSPQPIDAATRASIQSILEAAGYGSEVEFIDHEGSDDGHIFIKKVEKVVDAS
jgi:hypothetical protein